MQEELKIRRRLKPLKYKNQIGASLFEIILVLSLIAILMTSGLKLYANSRDNIKVLHSVKNIRDLSSNIRNVFANRKDYSFAISSSDLIEMGIVPDKMIKDGNKVNIYNVWGSVVIVKGGWSVAKVHDSFAFYYTGISKKVCMKLVTKDLGAIQIKGGSQESPKEKGSGLTVSRALSVCSALDYKGNSSSGLFLIFK